jgi:hypothetical protein
LAAELQPGPGYSRLFGAKLADLVATTVLSQLEGALLARTYRSLEPMHRAEQALKLLVKSSK